MTKAKAIECMDALTAIGYTVTVVASPRLDVRIPGGVHYAVSVSDLGFDRVDLRALMEVADRLGLETTVSRLRNGVVAFRDKDKTPEVRVVVHPRKVPGA
jgi:hypothetical protein